MLISSLLSINTISILLAHLPQSSTVTVLCLNENSNWLSLPLSSYPQPLQVLLPSSSIDIISPIQPPFPYPLHPLWQSPDSISAQDEPTTHVLVCCFPRSWALGDVHRARRIWLSIPGPFASMLLGLHTHAYHQTTHHTHRSPPPHTHTHVHILHSTTLNFFHEAGWCSGWWGRAKVRLPWFHFC